MEPRLVVTVGRTYIGKYFLVTLRMGSKWREQHNISVENIWNSVSTAKVVLVDLPESSHSRVAFSCPKCGGKQIVCLGASDRLSFGPIKEEEKDNQNEDFFERFVWNQCRITCSSSRLHMKSRYAILLEIQTATTPNETIAVISTAFEAFSKQPKTQQQENNDFDETLQPQSQQQQQQITRKEPSNILVNSSQLIQQQQIPISSTEQIAFQFFKPQIERKLEPNLYIATRIAIFTFSAEELEEIKNTACENIRKTSPEGFILLDRSFCNGTIDAGILICSTRKAAEFALDKMLQIQRSLISQKKSQLIALYKYY